MYGIFTPTKNEEKSEQRHKRCRIMFIESSYKTFMLMFSYHICNVVCHYIYIKNNAWVTVDNQIASRVTLKSLCTATNVSSYFLHAILCPENTVPLKISIADFAIVTKDGLFWLRFVTSLQLLFDVTQTWGTAIVTSYSSIVLARANRRKGDLH